MTRNKYKNRIAIIIILIIAFVGSGSKVIMGNIFSSSEQQSLRVLFIGNSYTYVNDLPWLTQQLSKSAGETRVLETEMIVAGGATLKKHWEDGAALRKIKDGRWHYVVLQEQSTLPITDPKVMHQYARLFDTEIKRANAQTVFYLTWARKNRPETQQALTNTYMKIARELDAKIAPVGIAWQEIQKHNPNLILYDKDQSHPSPIGAYIAACVFYATLYEKSPEGLTFRIYSTQFGTPQEGTRVEVDSLTQRDAEIIQKLVWNIVRTM